MWRNSGVDLIYAHMNAMHRYVLVTPENGSLAFAGRSTFF